MLFVLVFGTLRFLSIYINHLALHKFTYTYINVFRCKIDINWYACIKTKKGNTAKLGRDL